ncbi:MAG: InlB B-repeat-containing protein [Dysgonamonadaceae bacterium]|jgi:hypothetical protein|nr:InlB B-repeat-containing protein [Dysgonamonadaceae bacterium]
MAITAINTLKGWFQRGMKPLASQFAAWMDSFWHKSESIPITTVQGLKAALDSKIELSLFNEVIGRILERLQSLDGGHASRDFISLDDEKDVSFQVPASGGTNTYLLGSSHPWMVEAELTFLNVSPLSGPAGESQQVTIQVLPNSGAARSQSVVFANSTGLWARVTAYQLAANEFTLTIDKGNGATSDSYTYYAGQEITAPAAPAKNGFDFIGWRWSATGTLVSPGTKLTMPSSSASLTGEFLPVVEEPDAIITIDDHHELIIPISWQGGSRMLMVSSSHPWAVDDGLEFGTISPESGAAGEGQSITVEIFENGGGARSDTLVLATKDGIWCRVIFNQEAVKYRAQYQDEETGEMATDDVEYAAGEEAVINLPNLTRTGYRFLGWKASSYGGNPAFVGYKKSGDAYTMPEGGITLYSYWESSYIAIDGENDLEANYSFNYGKWQFTLDSSSAWFLDDGLEFGTVSPMEGPAGNGQTIEVDVPINTGGTREDIVVFMNEESKWCRIRVKQGTAIS